MLYDISLMRTNEGDIVGVAAIFMFFVSFVLNQQTKEMESFDNLKTMNSYCVQEYEYIHNFIQ